MYSWQSRLKGLWDTQCKFKNQRNFQGGISTKEPGKYTIFFLVYGATLLDRHSLATGSIEDAFSPNLAPNHYNAMQCISETVNALRKVKIICTYLAVYLSLYGTCTWAPRVEGTSSCNRTLTL